MTLCHDNFVTRTSWRLQKIIFAYVFNIVVVIFENFIFHKVV